MFFIIHQQLLLVLELKLNGTGNNENIIHETNTIIINETQ